MNPIFHGYLHASLVLLPIMAKIAVFELSFNTVPSFLFVIHLDEIRRNSVNNLTVKKRKDSILP